MDRSGGCHLWLGARNSKGYGRFNSGERDPNTKRLRIVMAHRWGYEHYVGPIPEGFSVLHRCDNPPCVNPGHLFLGTQADNVTDMLSKGRGNKARGAQNGVSKVTEDDVREIRRRAADGEVHRVIAADYGVASAHVSRIVRRESWSHIK